jgi:hypothetical protein
MPREPVDGVSCQDEALLTDNGGMEDYKDKLERLPDRSFSGAKDGSAPTHEEDHWGDCPYR